VAMRRQLFTSLARSIQVRTPNRERRCAIGVLRSIAAVAPEHHSGGIVFEEHGTRPRRLHEARSGQVRSELDRRRRWRWITMSALVAVAEAGWVAPSTPTGGEARCPRGRR
jgi:hypothetical protein